MLTEVLRQDGQDRTGKISRTASSLENSMIIFRIKFEFEVHTCTYKFCKSTDLKFPVSGRSIDRQIDR